MPKQLYKSSGRFNMLLFTIALLIIFALLFYTQRIVDDLRSEARGILQFYAEILARVASSDYGISNNDVSFIFDHIIMRSYFPIINTDHLHNPLWWKGIGVDEMDHSPENLEQVTRVMNQMKDIAEPIPVTFQSDTLGYLYYGDSTTITRLRWLPYIEIGLVGLFVMVGWIGFTTIKKSEQRFIWVGMAKETAHQLGTPISSLLGWVTLLKERSYNRPESLKVIDEMEHDIDRLGKVAERFSQIGSMSDLRDQNVNMILKNVVHYIKRRLPQSKKKVEVEEKYSEISTVPLNADLIEWVFENIIKNAVDAINHDHGKIEVVTAPSDRSGYKIYVDIHDNGRGIQFKNKNDVFKPGFSTKKRGWGLGLNLSKRIVEEYHQGKLIVKESYNGVGTTMRVYL